MTTIKSQNSKDWIPSREAAKILNCSPNTVIGLVQDGLLTGEKIGGRWMINLADVQAFQIKHLELSTQQQLIEEEITVPNVDAGMIEVSIALTGISAAIAALLPNVSPSLEWLKRVTAILAGSLAVYSAYSALWLLARYCLKKNSVLGFSEIWELLITYNLGPYWFMGLGLAFWFILSFLVIIIAIGG